MQRFVVLLSLALVLVLAPTVFAEMGHMGMGPNFAMQAPDAPVSLPVQVTALFTNETSGFAEVKDGAGHKFNVFLGPLQSSPELAGSLSVGKQITIQGHAMPFGFVPQAIEIDKAKFTNQVPGAFPFHGVGPWAKVGQPAAAGTPATAAAPAPATVAPAQGHAAHTTAAPTAAPTVAPTAAPATKPAPPAKPVEKPSKADLY